VVAAAPPIPEQICPRLALAPPVSVRAAGTAPDGRIRIGRALSVSYRREVRREPAAPRTRPLTPRTALPPFGLLRSHRRPGSPSTLLSPLGVGSLNLLTASPILNPNYGAAPPPPPPPPPPSPLVRVAALHLQWYPDGASLKQLFLRTDTVGGSGVGVLREGREGGMDTASGGALEREEGGRT
jgi:hypothetical protein